MKHLILIILIALNFNAFAQDDKTVTLVVSGSGKTQDEAKQNALRSAIEQAFGTFISSKTEILNDSLVKDEIVSVSNGNIQKFDIISQVQIPEGGFATTLKATVSVTKLTSFVESKGVVAEFKGSLLAVNVKQQILNEQNETKSIQSIVNTCKEILDHSCDFEIIRGEPKQHGSDNNLWAVPITISVKFNKNIDQFNQYLLNSLKSLSMSQEEVNQYEKLGKKTFKLAISASCIGGATLNIDDLRNIASSNPNLRYRIKQFVNDLIFETDDLKSLEKKIKTLYKENPSIRGYTRFEYYDPTSNPFYNFRSLQTVVSIIDLIYYTKKTILNFEVNNGLDTFNIKKLFANKQFNFTLIQDNFTPIFNTRRFQNGFTRLYKPVGLFHALTNYEPITEYSDNFFVDGFDKMLLDLTASDHVFRDDIIKIKFGFIYSKYYYLDNTSALISLYDYKNDGKIVYFNFSNIVSLSDLEKIEEYKVYPIMND